jgi:tetratricopeptide (TPR) repeat protein
MLDRRMLCLDRQLAEFDELVEVITGTKAESLARTSEAVLALPSLSKCEAAALELEGGLDAGASGDGNDGINGINGINGISAIGDAEVQLVRQLDRDLYRARSLEMTGAFAEALSLAKTSVDTARQLEDQTRLATALLTQAQIVMATGGHEAAAPLLEEAEFAAERAGADRLRGDILTALARVDAKARDGVAASRRVREARAVLDRVHAGRVEYAELDGVAALAMIARGQLDDAEQRVREAIASIANIGADEGSVELAQLHATLGVILRDLERYEEARVALERAQQLWIGPFGEQHPKVAGVRVELATVDAQQGRHVEAVANYEAGLAVLEQVFGPSSLDVGYVSAALAVSLAELGRHDEALRHLQRARAIFRAHSDQTEKTGKADMAIVSLARSLDAEGELRQRLEQPEPEAALSLHQQALQTLERARAVRGFDTRDLASVQVHLAGALLALDRPDEARAGLADALELLISLQSTPIRERERELIAEARVLAAKAWAGGAAPNPERARELAEAARADYVALGRLESVAEIDSWLADLAAPTG